MAKILPYSLATMNIKKLISSLPLVRPLFLRFLRATQRDVVMKNPWTGDRLLMNTFRHKGYWYFGKDREAATMQRFKELIKPGSTIIEVGGHIGFVSQYLAHLTGHAGRVLVFEPGLNNLPYLEQNVAKLPQVKIERMAVSDRVGEAVLYEDDITGQNNSLVKDYRRAAGVATSHKMEMIKTSRAVTLTTLEAYTERLRGGIDFIKIDIEGHEFAALQGAKALLSRVPALMVEITEHHAAIADLLEGLGFCLTDENNRPVDLRVAGYDGNVFATKSKDGALDGRNK